MTMYLILLLISVVQLSFSSLILTRPNSRTTEHTEDGVPLQTTTIRQTEVTFKPLEDHIPYEWSKVLWPSKIIPTDAVLGGIDSPQGCGMVYVGRALYKEHLLPAKICGSDGRAFVSFNGSEIMLNESEILRSRRVYWKPVTKGDIPNNAFPVGKAVDGETLYTGREFVNTLLTPGKVEKNSKKLFMSYDQKVYSTSEYEILILSSSCA